MNDDCQLLATALDVPADAMKGALDHAGGLVGLWHGRGESLGEALPSAARDRLDAWLELTDRALAALPPPSRIEGSMDVATHFKLRLGLQPAESFWVLLLDAHSRVIGEHRVAEGTLTACLVHPREVFAPAIRHRASHVVLVHNHPSGDPTPSEEDLALTERLTEAGQMIGIPVVDHVIVARTGFRSVGVAQTPLRRRRSIG